MTRLKERFEGATPVELAAWVYMTEPKQVCAKLNEKRERCSNEVLQRGDMCEEHGGKPMLEDEIKALRQHSLYAYLSARELDQPPPFLFGNHDGERDYLPLLYRLYFKADDVAQFEPRERFITGRALLVRWVNQTVIPPDANLQQLHTMQSERIRNATKESRLNPFHPTLGLTQATNTDDPFYAPLEEGLFSMTDVKAYEREEFGGELATPAAKVMEAKTVTSQSGDAPHALGSLDVFRSMQNLSGDELSITFMGGKPEHDKADLGANNMLKISARNETRIVAVASLDLVNKQRGGVNGEGAILIGFMKGMEPTKTTSNATKICRLRNIFKQHLGITSSPFHNKALGWKPRFNIEDKRGAGEERKKREIERYKMVSFDEMNERGEMASNMNQTPQSSEDDYPFDKEDDAAADFLSGNNA